MASVQWDQTEDSEYGRVLSDERTKPSIGIVNGVLLSLLGWMPFFILAFLGWHFGQML